MIVVFSGAGISKASGIDTFMDRPDVRDKLHRSYARSNPESYIKTIKELYNVISMATPNSAHIAIAKRHLQVITMNIDGLHEKAGSTNVISLHGTMPEEYELDSANELENKPVLYGDLAPNYDLALDIVTNLGINDIFLVIGASFYTQIAVHLRNIAARNGATVIEIQENAEHEVENVLSKLI